MPVLQSACGCCTVNVGAQVLGWIDIVFYVFRIIVSLYTPPVDPYSIEKVDDVKAIIEHYTLSKTGVIPISLIVIVISVLLLVGLEMRNKSLLIPYLILKAFVSVFIGICVYICLAVAVTKSFPMVIPAIICTIIQALQIYFWFWVYSAYQEIQDLENSAKYIRPQIRV